MSGMIKIDAVKVSMATPIGKVEENFHRNKFRDDISNYPNYLANKRIAIVGGGPSLKETITELKEGKYQEILACGSVHKFLMENGVIPTMTIVCDPDPVMASYISPVDPKTTFFVATQCDPPLFDLFNKSIKVHTFNAGGSPEFNKIFDRGTILTGGCTVGTRGIMLALDMGYSNIELFGFDTCVIDKDTHHAYNFSSSSEELGKLTEIALIEDGKKYLLADYMVGQLFDFKNLLIANYARMNVTSHGHGILTDYLELCSQKAKALMSKGVENGI